MTPAIRLNNGPDATHRIDAGLAFELLYRREAVALDVRSEKEFAQGHFGGSNNHPILNNDHRHAVGLTYKTQGNETATKLGHQLVAPLRGNLIESWRRSLLASEQKLLFCWRGGQRSKIAGYWLSQAGCPTLRVVGGYKALRRQALGILAQEPKLLVLAGYTGSDKTALLQTLPQVLDIEAIANHKGSAFGAPLGSEQPSQATFENDLALAWARLDGSNRLMICEDESRNLGRCFLPIQLHRGIQTSPLVVLEISLAERVENILRDYVVVPLQKDYNILALQDHYTKALARLKRRLGGALHQKILSQLQTAFAVDIHANKNGALELHRHWISTLLGDYYDRGYDFSMQRLTRDVLFRGDRNAVAAFLKEQVT